MRTSSALMRVVHPVSRSGSGLQPKLAEFLQTCGEEIPSRDDDDDDDDEAEYADDGEDETEDDPCWSTLVGRREIGNASRTRTRTRIRTQLTRGAGQSWLADQALGPTRTPSIACGRDRRACTWRLGRHHELEDLEAAGGGRITVMHAQPTHLRTHTFTHIPTYQSTQASCTRAACKLCARTHP